MDPDPAKDAAVTERAEWSAGLETRSLGFWAAEPF